MSVIVFSLAFSPSTKNDPATLLKSVVPFPFRQERSLADCYKMQIMRWLTQGAPRCRPALPEADYLAPNPGRYRAVSIEVIETNIAL
jgi:hypothetical protein